MDLNLEYASHQKALIRAGAAENDSDRLEQLAKARLIAGRIGGFQQRLGAAAACAWSKATVAGPKSG